ncbi:hypothetical protein O3I_023825 [Nocardia brasiliensis ATCC 700358]|uniref:Uncharacterized protein n=1 Tax=Nocardia brasiliensis (strain ATCC 700358 / HUJEG-1) TaxID=1133849 RepID=K0F0Q0_NOCB7|nr:hypothetical protein O3I_023825 [Nocardia brasiliensis ATCC 700358]
MPPPTATPAGTADGTTPAPAPDVARVEIGQEGIPKVGEWATAGDYRLSMLEGGTLELARSNGEVVQTWAPDKPVDVSRVVLSVDDHGSLRIQDAVDLMVPRVPFTPGSSLGTQAAGLELTEDGRLVAVDRNATRYPIFESPPPPPPAGDGIDIAARDPRFAIDHPSPESDALNEAINVGQAAINKLTDPAQVGTLPEHPAPPVKGELVAANLIDDQWDSTMIRDYSVKIGKMQEVGRQLNEGLAEVGAVTEELPLMSEKALNDISFAVSMLNVVLAVSNLANGWTGRPAFPNDSKMIQAVYNTVRTAVDRIDALRNDLIKKAEEIDNPDPGPPPGPPAPADPDAPPPGSVADLPPGDSGGPTVPPGSPASTTLQAASGADPGLTDGIPGLADVEGPAGEVDRPESDESLADLIESAADDRNSSGTAAGGDPTNGMVAAAPLLAMAAAQFAPVAGKMMSDAIAQQQRQQERERERAEFDHARQIEQPLPLVGPPAAGAAPAAPEGVQPTAVGAPPPVPPPPVVPRNVDLPLDGHNYRVSEVVAGAVHAAVSNPNGSDAVAAYNGTAGDPASWTQIPEAEVRSGDVVKWEHRTALVLADDTGLHTIVNGALVPLDPNRPPEDGHGQYGNFEHFLRPAGTAMAPENVGVTAPQVTATAAAVPPVPEVTTARQ